MISWYFFVLTQSYSVSPGADGQDSGWLVPRSMLHFFFPNEKSFDRYPHLLIHCAQAWAQKGQSDHGPV